MIESGRTPITQQILNMYKDLDNIARNKEG